MAYTIEEVKSAVDTLKSDITTLDTDATALESQATTKRDSIAKKKADMIKWQKKAANLLEFSTTDTDLGWKPDDQATISIDNE